MPARLIRLVPVVAALAALTLNLGSPALANASDTASVYAKVLQAYQTSGSVPPCQFTSQQLAAAMGAVDTYGQQYYADFIAAIQTALTYRASGVCSAHRRAFTAKPGSQGPAGPPVPPSVTAASSSGIPAPLIVLAIAAALLACAAALAAVVSRSGALAEWRHAWAEARYRAGGGWRPRPRADHRRRPN